MNGSNNRRVATSLLVLYVVLVGIVSISVFMFPSIYNFLDDRRIEKVEDQVHQALTAVDPKEKLDSATREGDVELFILKNNQHFYSSLPIKDFGQLQEVVKRPNLLFEKASEERLGENEYLVWLAIYPQDPQKRYEYLVLVIGTLLIITFAVLLLIFIQLQRRLTGPLIRLKESIVNLKEFKFDEAIKTTDYTDSGGILSDIGTFSKELKKNIDQFGNKYAELEMAYEQEHWEKNYRENLFLSLIHDLKTPLSIMMLSVEQLLTEEQLSLELEEKLQQLSRLQDKLMDEINVLVKSSKRKIDLDTEGQVDVTKAVQQAQKRFKTIIFHKKLYSEIVVPYQLEVNLVPVELEQILHNIFSNITNHIRIEGFFSISISFDETTEMLQIDAYNDIEPGQEIDFEHAFDLFYQSQASREHYGTGMGMYIIRSIVEKNYGSYRFFPDEGGVRLVVTLACQRRGGT